MCRCVRCPIDKGAKIKREWVKASRESAYFDVWVAHLGISWALLAPSWGVQEGILRHFGLGRLVSGVQGGQKLGCHRRWKTNGSSTFFADF